MQSYHLVPRESRLILNPFHDNVVVRPFLWTIRIYDTLQHTRKKSSHKILEITQDILNLNKIKCSQILNLLKCAKQNRGRNITVHLASVGGTSPPVSGDSGLLPKTRNRECISQSASSVIYQFQIPSEFPCDKTKLKMKPGISTHRQLTCLVDL